MERGGCFVGFGVVKSEQAVASTDWPLLVTPPADPRAPQPPQLCNLFLKPLWCSRAMRAVQTLVVSMYVASSCIFACGPLFLKFNACNGLPDTGIRNKRSANRLEHNSHHPQWECPRAHCLGGVTQHVRRPQGRGRMSYKIFLPKMCIVPHSLQISPTNHLFPENLCLFLLQANPIYIYMSTHR